MGLTRSDQKVVKETIQHETKGLQEEFSKLRDDLVVLKNDVGEIKTRVNLLPTKDEFFSKLDEVVGELQSARQEQTLLSQHSRDHEDRISSLEEIHPEGQHPVN